MTKTTRRLPLHSLADLLGRIDYHLSWLRQSTLAYRELIANGIGDDTDTDEFGEDLRHHTEMIRAHARHVDILSAIFADKVTT